MSEENRWRPQRQKNQQQRFERLNNTFLGVNSPARAFGAVGGGPRFLSGVKDHTSGILMGIEYIDYVCSWGPLILGQYASAGCRR